MLERERTRTRLDAGRPTGADVDGSRLAEFRRRRREILGERTAEQRAELLDENRQASGQ